MEELRCVDNKKWILIAIAVLLLSGGFGSQSDCGTGIGGSGMGGFGNIFDNFKCGNNSWIWILAIVFLFSGGF